MINKGPIQRILKIRAIVTKNHLTSINILKPCDATTVYPFKNEAKTVLFKDPVRTAQ